MLLSRQNRSCRGDDPSLQSAFFSRARGHGPRAGVLANSQRVCWAGLGVGLAVMLLVAFCLNPDSSGIGTHRQLGLPPCTFLTLFGGRCPSCGMTTSWTLLVRGKLLESLHANAAGALLGVMAILVSPWAIVSASRGRWLWGRPNANLIVLVSSVVIVLAVVQWIWRLVV